MKTTLLTLLFFIMGCAGVQLISEKADLVIIRSTARTLGYKIAEQHPDKTDMMVSYCDAILGKQDSEKMVKDGILYLIEKYGNDPLLKATFRDMAELLEINIELPEKIDMTKARIAVEGFREGLLL